MPGHDLHRNSLENIGENEKYQRVRCSMSNRESFNKLCHDVLNSYREPEGEPKLQRFVGKRINECTMVLCCENFLTTGF